MQRGRTAVLLVALVLAVPGPAGHSGGTDAVARLAVGASAFWDARAPQAATGRPTCAGEQPCRDYALVLAGGGERLRVAIDTAGLGGATLELYGPDGGRVGRAGGVYSAEVFAATPEPGRYVVHVPSIPPGGYRLRARLERVIPDAGDSPRPLLPNLRLVPPYEFTLEPLTAGFDRGCNPYERVEYGATRCLRFSLGPANVGEGPFMLRFPFASGIAAPEPVYQLIRYADGSERERQAGTALFHKTHAHHHHNGFGSLELMRVVDPRRGRMVLAGRGPKQGFCTVDYLIAEWRTFRNDERNSVRADCGVPGSADSTQLGLSAGWADIYVYSLDGNYVDFGSNPDGRYVVRSVADAQGDVLETDETDNAGYAYLEIRGTAIRVLERGHGTSPWDPRKRLADDILPPNA